jgi:hypothetical protein
VKKPPTPPPDEYATFRRLAKKLVAVPKKELDKKRRESERRHGTNRRDPAQ